jgi:hypothetical protein
MMIHLVGGIASERREPGPGTGKRLIERWGNQMNRNQRHHVPFPRLESIPTGQHNEEGDTHTAREDTQASSIVFIPSPLEIKSE